MALQKIKLFTKQIEALHKLRDDSTNEIMYGGGARGGKSWLGNLWVMMETYEKPNSAWLIGRSSFTDLRDTTLSTFFKVIKEYGVASDFSYNAQTHIMKNNRTNSIIYFKELGWFPSDPEYDRLGSFDLTGCFIDECQQVRKKVTDVIKARFSVLEGDGWQTIPKSFYSCNPSLNWVMKDFVKPHDDGTLEGDKCFIRSLVTDNPYVPQAYIDNLKKADKVTIERLLYGNFYYDNDPRKLVETDKIIDLYTNTYVEDGRKYLVGDIATRGSDRFVLGYWNGFRLEKIFSEDKSTGKGIIEKMQEMSLKYGIPNSNIVYDADGVGSALSGFIANTNEFKNGSKAKGNQNYNHLKSQCYFKLAEYINEGKIYISDSSYKDLLTEELEHIKRDNVDKDGKLSILAKDKVKEHLGRSPDFSDMLMMRMYFEVQGQIESFNADFF